MTKSTKKLLPLPLDWDVETKAVLKSLPSAHATLAELKGIASTMPNQNILINTLGLQEAKDSSAIENIITTHDDLYKSELNLDSHKSLNAKEVQNYIAATKTGFDLISKTGLLTNRIILKIQEVLEGNKAGFRKLPGTTLKNASTGEIIYSPPQDPEEIKDLMTNLEKFINDKESSDLDPLVKMAIIHYQFESIHPFYDGNGRTGRIINILYLMLKGLLDSPILYLSGFIIHNKGEYYRLLRDVTFNAVWEPWILYVLKGIEQTATETIKQVNSINSLMLETIEKVKAEKPNVYSKEFIELLFEHPYSKIEHLEFKGIAKRKTAGKYLAELADIGILEPQKIGKEVIYINKALYELLKK